MKYFLIFYKVRTINNTAYSHSSYEVNEDIIFSCPEFPSKSTILESVKKAIGAGSHMAIVEITGIQEISQKEADIWIR